MAGNGAQAAKAVFAAFQPLRGKPNFFEVARNLPNFGVGSKIKRNAWEGDNCYWTVTKIHPDKDGRHGKAWGVLTWAGAAQEKQSKIPGTLKRIWSPLSNTPFVAVPERVEPASSQPAEPTEPAEPSN
mmetsp:Transcript_30567/g.66691  ORF Transcript_30567/g.66691 Transcript_30567/m.66691 type:complete len:128 (-) Transcript_30567:303-686(-)|eukprot:CAMPEP_0118933760 /NCGR_PEP_ID=MMETSP1169-20130426/12383_1 /TAXON_ID=36882 /ORGANISM="Pyramimonas obovata, Strain CCMP722" /LENGTH=127 /DNA_ID=CAMNT_0006876569 /DNA_START=86 /DNA_END=469 /DNA_ORIENTATION=+